MKKLTARLVSGRYSKCSVCIHIHLNVYTFGVESEICHTHILWQISDLYIQMYVHWIV